MNGVSRFLSRRDKHHEKRQSKHESKHDRSKVQSPSTFSPASPLRPICSVDGAASEDFIPGRRPRPNSLQSLYHKLPSFHLPSAQDKILFSWKRPPSPDFAPLCVQASTIDSSDHLTLQSHQVPTHLYTIFSSEEVKNTEKDGEKKVRIHHLYLVPFAEQSCKFSLQITAWRTYRYSL